MRRLFLAFLILASAGISYAQSPPIALDPPLFSLYGYPTLVIAGSDRQEETGIYSEIDTVTAWTADGANATLTANNTLHVGDRVYLKGFLAANQSFSYNSYVVSSVTATTFTIPYTGTAGSGTETTATARGISGTGFTGKGTWTITNTGSDTSETYKLYSQDGTQATAFSSSPSLSGAPPYINFTVGSVEGTCSHTGSITTSDFAEHSTVEFNITFTSDDNPAVSHSHHYLVCHNGGGWKDSGGNPLEGKVFPKPGIRTVYTDRNIPLDSVVMGNVNQMVNWTIVTAPVGGDANLLYATYPQPVFQSGTVPGLYRIKACPAVDSRAEACAYVTIIVSNHTSLPAANTDKVEQTPCDSMLVNAIAWGSHYTIGPSQTMTDLLALPQFMTGPVLVQILNEGAAGSPTEYHNQWQVNLPSGGPFSDNFPALFVCGVPNPTTGELPIIDGANATVTSWASQWIVGPYGLISVTGGTGGPQTPDGNNMPLSYATFQGLHVRNVTSGYQFYQAGNTSTLSNWGGSMSIRPYGVQYWTLIGNHMDNVANALFDDCNPQQSNWPMCTQDTFYEGNHLEGYSLYNSYTEHPMYLQAFRTTVMLNLLDGTIPGALGTSFFSDRGLHTMHQYNRLYPKGSYSSGSVGGGHSEIQDAYNYVNDDERWGYQGAANCFTYNSEAPGCMGITGVNDMDWFAALDETHSNTEFIIGNAINMKYAVKTIGAAMTHNWASYQSYTCPADHPMTPGNLTQKEWVDYNTITYDDLSNGGLSFWEDVRLQVQDSTDYRCQNPHYYPRGFFANNILPTRAQPAGCGDGGRAYCSAFNSNSTAMMEFQTNMVTPNAYTPGVAVNITYDNAMPVAGINKNPVTFDWGGTSENINLHMKGWDTANFIPYANFPVDTFTLAPYTSSDAVGKATAITGPASYFPPRFNAVDDAMSPFVLRTDTTTLGAMDPLGTPNTRGRAYGTFRMLGVGQIH